MKAQKSWTVTQTAQEINFPSSLRHRSDASFEWYFDNFSERHEIPTWQANEPSSRNLCYFRRNHHLRVIVSPRLHYYANSFTVHVDRVETVVFTLSQSRCFFHLANFFMLSLSREKCVMNMTKHAWVNKAIHLVRMCWI